MSPATSDHGRVDPDAGTAHPAVAVEHLSIRFRTTSESTIGRLRTLRSRHRFKARRTIDALTDVSFEVDHGRVFGVIGRNGAGKSTLFRAIAGILAPDEGRIVTCGRVTPLLSLGIGFNRELTGRENAILGGLAAGLHMEEIRANFDDILAFADLGEAIDSPMRTYSSGMFGRLGFAIAAHLQPEILLIDEALSAGDASFRKKTTAKIEELCAEDVTVLIVTHGVGLITKLADDCLWLEKGTIRMIGPAAEVVDAYKEAEEGDAAPDAAIDEDI